MPISNQNCDIFKNMHSEVCSSELTALAVFDSNSFATSFQNSLKMISDLGFYIVCRIKIKIGTI